MTKLELFLAYRYIFVSAADVNCL